MLLDDLVEPDFFESLLLLGSLLALELEEAACFFLELALSFFLVEDVFVCLLAVVLDCLLFRDDAVSFFFVAAVSRLDADEAFREDAVSFLDEFFFLVLAAVFFSAARISLVRLRDNEAVS